MTHGHHHHEHFGKPDAVRLAVSRCGPIAHEVLSEDGDLFVIGVYDRAFHLACPRGIVCVGTEEIGAGPINVELAATPAPGNWAALGITPDCEGRIEHGVPFITETLAIDLSAASIWSPPPPPAFDRTRAAAGLQRLRALAQGRLPRDGLSRLVLTGTAVAGNAEAQMAADSIAELRAALPGALDAGSIGDTLVRPATLLVGLGPGLTPSGDDVLGGMMLALAATGRQELCDALWEALVPELDALTVPISAMHLSAAADGLASAAMHDLVNALLGDAEALDQALRAAASAGHTSGWDAIAGLVLGLDGVLATAPRP